MRMCVSALAFQLDPQSVSLPERSTQKRKLRRSTTGRFGLSLSVFRSSDTAKSFDVEESVDTPLRQFKEDICDIIGVDPARIRMWDYFRKSKHALLEGKLDNTLDQ